MSQMPETPFAGWAEQGYDPSAYPQQAEAQSAQNQPAPHNAAAWQQDTEPDWGASQQGYPEQDYPEQGYSGSEYAGQDYAGNDYAGAGYQNQQYPGYPPQQGQGYPAQPDPTMAVPQQPMAGQDTGSGLPTEFDHLFRDSPADSRRAIDRQKPAVGGAGAGYLAGAQSAAAPMPTPEAAAMPDQTALAPQGGQYQQYQQPFPQQGEQYGEPYGEQFPGPAPGAYQGSQFQNGAYAQPQTDYGQGGGYGSSGGPFGGGGGAVGGRLRNPRTLIIGGAVALAAIIGIVIATSNGGGSSSGTPGASSSNRPTTAASKATPKQQADQIYQLIQQSGQLRSAANTAVIDVNGCKDLSNAQNALSTTAQQRQAQADSVGKLDVSGIQNGSQLIGQLKAAWTASAQYDNAYAQIAGDVQNGCKSSSVHNDSNQSAVQQAATAADTAKAQAAQLWNDNVATPLGESQVSSDKL